MLEKLNQIDWANLTHAYGTAEDLPILIQLLLSEKEEDRKYARSELYSNIWHQGTIFEATPYVVPFLIELVENESTPEREKILVYLGRLANGNRDIEALLEYEDFEIEEDEIDEIQELLKARKNTLREIHKGMPIYFRLLHHQEPLIRSAAAHLLGQLGPYKEEELQILRQTLENETDELVRTNLILALAYIKDESPITSKLLEEQLDEDQNEFLKLVSAISLTILGKREQKILLTLVEYMKERNQVIIDKFSNLPGEDISIKRDILSLITQFPREETLKILDELIEAFKEDCAPIDVFVHVFISIAFGK
jgi:HEAT repeat protein